MKGYRARTGQVWLYYIRSGDDGPIKIGLADDPWKRLKELQTGNPEKLAVIGVESITVPTEAQRHAMFAEERIRERLLDWIARMRWLHHTDAVLTFPDRFDPDLAAEVRAAADEILATA